ncbi:MAG: SDR family oxidoreductase [Ignavibacteriae bacterium]|nr:SDR family oxidoreductase [Ignavibacteriota bacterium]
MKVLFIGGTGNISSAVSQLAINEGIDLYLLNRGQRNTSIAGAKTIACDITNSVALTAALNNHTWDVVVNWIAFKEQDVLGDIALFKGKTKQYIFISSASAYQKPLQNPVITENTPLENPFWQYSRDKIACEAALQVAYKREGFPITIVRPSHTYNTIIPVTFGGSSEYTTVDRIKRGKKIIVHGDGTSLWTLTHADDFAVGFLGLLGHPKALGEAFHITSDESLTWNQIHETVAAAVGCEVHIVHIASDLLVAHNEELRGNLIGDKATTVIFDNSKIKSFVPGFSAKIPFTEGIKRTLDWFDADPSRKIIKQDTNDWIDAMIERYERVLPTAQ